MKHAMPNPLPTDTALLNFLTDMGTISGLKWIARPSGSGRGWRLHQDKEGQFETPRQAIAAAMQSHDYLEAHHEADSKAAASAEQLICGNIVFQREYGAFDGGHYAIENPPLQQRVGIPTRNLTPADLRAMADHLEAQRRYETSLAALVCFE